MTFRGLLTGLEDAFSCDTFVGTEGVTRESESIGELENHVAFAHTVVPGLREASGINALERGWRSETTGRRGVGGFGAESDGSSSSGSSRRG
jgi:hypothetical protein